MRVNIKLMLITVFIVLLFISVTFFAKCQFHSFQRNLPQSSEDMADLKRSRFKDNSINEKFGYEDIDCFINGEYSVSCRREGDEVYIPFSFLHKYFEVYGKLASYDGLERFEWSHSFSKVYQPKSRYDPRGVFMYFENYNVEVRDRVKCLSAIEGVPMSTQWESQGYFYPTQIAQFGLSHYSKNLTEPEPRRKVIEDADRDFASWSALKGAKYTRKVDRGTSNHVMSFRSTDLPSSQVVLFLDHVLDLTLKVDLKLTVNSSIVVTLQCRDTGEIFYLHYVAADFSIQSQMEHTFHGVGHSGNWVHITRDLVIDIMKGFFLQNGQRRKISRSKIKVIKISLQGNGELDNLTLSSNEHMANFYDAAEWFVKYQDPTTGGWPNPVTRRLASGMAELAPGWNSAMGQGHGISVLARAYHHSGGDSRYLRCALDALRPFRTPSKDGGVLAHFLGQFPWYEEYPTQPPSFVLNGFIYSLLGLYDLKTIAPLKLSKEAEALFDQGMKSLKALLTLFDMGSTTSYDLRHFTLKIAPNIARWDYHATHVNQLLLLASIDSDPLLTSTAHRWLNYMNGKRATHN